MTHKEAVIIDDLSRVMEAKLAEFNELQVELGEFSSRIPLARLQELFHSFSVVFVSQDKEYALIGCKMSPDSSIEFRARVLCNELERIETTTVSFKVPSPEGTTLSLEKNEPEIPEEAIIHPIKGILID